MRKVILSLLFLLPFSPSLWADFLWTKSPPATVPSGQAYTVAVTAEFQAQSVNLLLNKNGSTVKGTGGSSPTVAPVSVSVSYNSTDTATGSDSTIDYTAVANIYPAQSGISQYTSGGTTRVIAPNTAPSVQWTKFPSDHKGTAGQSFTIQGHATDPDGNLVNIRITNFNTGAILSDTWFSPCSALDSPVVTVNQATAADMRFRIEAWDGKLSSYSDLSVVVGNPNHAPGISWVGTISSGAVINQSFAVQAKGTDADGNLATVTVLRDDQPFSTGGAGDGYQSTSTSASYSQAAVGSTRFSAEAVDALGVSSGKIYQTVNVNLVSPNDSGNWNPTAPSVDPGVPSGASLIVGAATGSFEVDNKGSGNYTLPLKIPPGRAGFQPSLSLGYSSGSGNGPVGLGWSLSHGFPQKIQRGRKISARDGDTLSRGPNFDADDKFYLDGKRLIVVSGTEGQPGSEYRTEVDSFVKVKATGTGNIIDTFVVQDKAGHSYTFGKYNSTSDGYQMGAQAGETLAYAYAIKHAEDALGNSIEFNYTDVLNATGARLGEYVLGEIVYTGNPGLSLAGAARVRFQYNTLQVNGQTERPDRTISYVATRRFAQSRRLDSINIESDTGSGFSRVGYYLLAYDIAPNGGNTRLLSLTPYLLNSSKNAFESLQKTRFDWTEASQAVAAQAPYALPTKNGDDFNGYNPFAFGDFDGDGKEDYIDARSSLTVYLSTGTSFSAPESWMDPAALPPDFNSPGVGFGGGSVFVADVNGDGKKDLILANVGFKKFYVVVSTGKGFIGLDGGPGPTLIAGNGVHQIGGVDVTDLAFRDPLAGNELSFELLSVEKGGAGARVTVADFTGDGRDDLLLHGYDGYFYTLISQGNSFGPARRSAYAAQACSVLEVLDWDRLYRYIVHHKYEIHSNYTVRGMPVDINGDGLMDYAWVETYRTSPMGLFYNCLKQLKVAIALPGGEFTAPQTIDAQSLGGMAGEIHQEDLQYYVLPGDYNGDGLSDFLVLRGKNVSAPNKRWTLLRSRGTTSAGQANFEYTPGILPDSLVVGSDAIPTMYSLVTPFGWTSFHLDVPFGGSNHPLMSQDDPLFFMHVEASSGENSLAVDLNQDGLTDYIWYVASANSNGVSPASKGWYVCYSSGTGFRSPVRLSGHPWDDIAPRPLDGDPNITWLSLSQRGDINGDGIPDWAYESSNPAKDEGLKGWFLSQGTPGNVITEITDGLNKKTRIAYSTVRDNAIYTAGVPVTYPITERRTGNAVVSDVYQDSGDASQPAQYSYQYSGNRIDLSGRGGLGFHSFVTLDRQTGLFKYQFLTQSFPMTGLAAREQTYRSWALGSDLNFRIISSHDNTVVFDEVTEGTNSYGTVYPFISRAIESRWEDGTVAHFSYTAGGASSKPESLFPDYGAAKPAGAHITISAESLFDGQTAVQTTVPGAYNPSDTTTAGVNSVNGYTSRADYNNLVFPKKITFGNLKQLKTDFGDGFFEKVVTTYKTAPSGTNLTGLVDTVATTTTSPGYATETAPTKTYTYKGNTPLISSEFVDASGATNGSSDLSLTTTYTYDDRGRVTSTSISSSDTTIGSYTVSGITEYNDRFDLPVTVKDAYDHATTTGYDSVWGLPKSVTDYNNVQVSTTYDSLGRALTTTRTVGGFALSTETTFGWTTADAADWQKTQTVSGPIGLTLSSVYAIHTSATVQPSTTTYYDRLGRVIRTIKEGFGTQKTYTDTAYDVLGRVVASSLPYPSDGSPLWTKTTYDALGRVSTVTAPNGTVTSNKYVGRATQTTVKATGVDAQTNTTYVDAKGRTIKVWNADNDSGALDPSSGSSAEASIEYKLDGFGRMRQTILKGQTQKISATYDALGRQVSLSDPDKGRWAYLNNALGQVVNQKDAVGNVTSTTFDHLGRPLIRTTTEAAGPVETASWFYYNSTTDAATHTVAKGEKGWIGAPQREESSTSGAPGYAASNSATTTVHYYDSLGHPTIDLSTIDGKWFYTYRDYDQYSRLNAVRHYWKPAGHETAGDVPYAWQDFGYSYTYDQKSYLLSLQDSTGKLWWEADTTKGYDYLDRPVLVRKGARYWTQRTYKAEDGTLTGIATGSISGSTVSGTVQDLSFGFDGLGNLTARGDNLHNLSETYGYDNLNRLTKRGTTTIANYLTNGNIDWKYDVAGTKSANYTYDSDHPHAVKNAWGYGITYDANGNMLTRSKTGETWSTRWTGFDKPRWLAKGATGSEFVYNAARSRILHLEFDATTTAGLPSHYTHKKIYAFGPTVENDYINTAGVGAPSWILNKTRIYVPGPEGSIGTMEFAGSAKLGKADRALVYHYDHIGSIESITPYGDISKTYALDETGLPSRYSYEAWGQRRDAVEWSGAPDKSTHGGKSDLTPRGFTGHEMLDEIGLVHMNGRIYDPLVGRFLSADVVVQAPWNLQSFNRYSYVMNNPLSLVDPSGFAAEAAAAELVTAEETAAAMAEVRQLLQSTPPQWRGVVLLSLPFLMIKGDSGPRPAPAPKPIAPVQPQQPKTNDPSKPMQPTPHEVKIDPNSIQANQGDTVKPNQSPTQQVKPDAPKQDAKTDDAKKTDQAAQKDEKQAASDKAKGVPGKDLPGKGGDWVKLKGDQGWKDSDGNIWKKDQLHKDHWDVSDRKGNKVREVDYNGDELWPNGPKNKNK